MRVGVIALRSLGLVAGVLAGCSTATYHGASPCARTMSESPAMKDYYVGMNFNFSLDQPEKYRRTGSADGATAVAGMEGSGAAQASTGAGGD